MKKEEANYGPIPSEEFVRISNSLERHHAVFYKLWNLGAPYYTDITETAFVAFDKLGDCVQFGVNKKFWDYLTDYEKEFVVCHECMHVILSHGRRINFDATGIANIAGDIVINHLLVKRFGFDRSKIRDVDKYCWIDTVFKDKKVLNTVKPDESLEYYYNLIKNEMESKGGKNSGSSGDTPSTVDDHGKMMPGEDSDQINKKLSDGLSDEEKNSIKDMIEKHFEQDNKSVCGRGTEAGNTWIFVNVGEVKKKRKWETVIQKWANRFLFVADKEIEQWARTNRRMTFMNSEFFLPSEMEVEAFDEEKKKIPVWFFQDTSGSCSHLAKRFFTAAKTLPTDRFDIRMFCFDTRVHETSLESGKLYGFGGTSFTCIEEYIQQEILKNKCEYPLAVFVITDGYGDNVYPKYPKNWYWFLSTSSRSCIPKECNIFQLSNFE